MSHYFRTGRVGHLKQPVLLSINFTRTFHRQTGMALKPIVTPALLSAVREHPNLPRHCWYFIMATTLSILNRPDELPKLFAHAIESGPDAKEARPSSDDELKIARRFREALIKAAAVGGLPKVSCPTSINIPTTQGAKNRHHE